MTKYKEITLKELNANLSLFEILLKATYREKGKKLTNIKVSRNAVLGIERRIHQRRAYYEYFHSSKKVYEISEIKDAALRSYWILKYRPLFRIGDDDKDIGDDNVFFAFWSLVHTLSEYIRKQFEIIYPKEDQRKFKELRFPRDLIKIALHTFRECDMSKEEMILYSTTLHALLISYNK